MKRIVRRIAGALCGLCLLAGGAMAGEAEVQAGVPTRVMVFDIELIDTSGEGVLPEHGPRLDLVSRVLRDRLAAAGTLEVVGPPADAPRIRTCNGCEVVLAREAKADFAVTGIVYKVSTLVLSITLEVTDTATGRTAVTAVADIRGDNDRAWSTGVAWLVEHRLLADRARD